MRRTIITILLALSPFVASAEDIRGPVTATLLVQPNGPEVEAEIGIDDILLVDLDGDPRFHDAIEIELIVPEAAVSLPGALSVLVLTTGSVQERAGVTEINGAVLHSQPLVRESRLIIQIPLRAEAVASASAAVTVLETVLTAADRPVAVSIQTRMKGVPLEISSADLVLVARSVPRNIGSVRVSFENVDGDTFDPDGLVAPDFRLAVDGIPVDIAGEFLLEPGLHQFSLRSEKFLDQTLTVGVQRASVSTLEIPLLPALATVAYTAPRGSRVYIDGRSLDRENGAFTAVPGEHTIVVVVGDYTVSRRFDVQEGREYNLSVTMDVAIEEAK